MKHVLLILFLFLFLPTASFAKTYPYNGKTALLSDSKKAGGRHDWLRLCAGKYSKHAREIEKEVKKLSTPDYKMYRKGISAKRAKNYTWASGCKEHGAGSMRWMTNYVKKLKKRVDVELGITTTTAQKIRYCQRSNGTVYDTLSVSNKPCANVKEITKVEYDRVKKLGNKPSKTTSTQDNKKTYCFHYNNNTRKIVKFTCPIGFTEVSQSYYNDNLFGFKDITVSETTSTGDDKLIYCINEFKKQKQIRTHLCYTSFFEVHKFNYDTKYKNYTEIGSNAESETASTTESEKKENQIAEEKKQKELTEQKQFEDQQQRNKELQEAQHYINDLQQFVKVNPTTFDILKVTKLMIASKDILKGVWNADQQNNFNAFKEYTDTSDAFLAFHAQQTETRQKTLQDQTNAEMDKLNSYISDLTSYLQNNLTSVLAPKIVEQIESAQAVLEKKKLQELINANQKIASFMQKLNQIDAEVIKLNNYVHSLTTYLHNDLTSVLAPEIVEQIESAQAAIERKNLQELSQANKDTASFMQKLNQIDAEVIKLGNYVSILTTYLHNDLTSDLAPEIVEQIESAQAAIERKNLQELSQTKKNIANFITKEEKRIAKEKIYSDLKKGIFKKNPNNLPICKPDIADIKFNDGTLANWNNCWGTLYYSGDRQWGSCVGGCRIDLIVEGEILNVGVGFNGFSIEYQKNDIYVGNHFNGRMEGNVIHIEGMGFENRSACKLSTFNIGEGGIVSDKIDCSTNKELLRNLSNYNCDTSYPWICSVVESKDVSILIDVNKEYVALSNANIRKEPSVNSEIVTTIEKGTTVLVQKKTQSSDWYLIKEIKKNWGDEDIGEILGYSSADLYQSLDTLGVSENENTGSEKYSEPPGILLTNAYLNYTIIKKMHELREGYAVVYISDNQMSEAKKQIQEIEDILLSKFKLDEDLLWDMAMKKYKKDYSSVDLIASTGHYSEDGSRVAMMVLLGLDSIAKEVVGSSMDKDF